MSVEQMRAMIRQVYDGPAWKHKVDKMPEYQVATIYKRMLNSGRLKGMK